jgi:hypothetical protein
MPKEKKAVLKIKDKAKPAIRPKKIEEVKKLFSLENWQELTLEETKDAIEKLTKVGIEKKAKELVENLETNIHEEKVVEERQLTQEQELFCQYYVAQEFFANGVKSYMEAYQVEPTPKGYESAKHGAYRLLQELHICTRINNLLELSGLNDNFVDKQMEFLITQNADFSAKVQAMKMYNDIKGRVVKKLAGFDGGTIKTESTLNIKLL